MIALRYPRSVILTWRSCYLTPVGLPIATDETRAGERGVSPFELLKMLSGAGPCELRSLPARCLWQLDRLFLSLLRPMHRRKYSEIHDAGRDTYSNPIRLIFGHTVDGKKRREQPGSDSQ